MERKSPDLDEDADRPLKKHQKTFRLTGFNKNYSQGFMKEKIKAAFESSADFKLNDSLGAEVCSQPFRHMSMPNFIADKDFVAGLITELQALEVLEKNNDLYKFKQSLELKHARTPCIRIFRNILQDYMLPWLRDVTNFQLNDKISLFCSQYQYSDVLLCHDDELEDRHIAFIYYLVPESWSKDDGGTLDLFSRDDTGQPKDIVKHIVPVQDTFVFFEVTPHSFHQVSEVLSDEKTRLALSGWFHGPAVRWPSPFIESRVSLMPCGSVEEEVFCDWINPIYLSPEIQTDIKERFVNESEIELFDFIKEEKYAELLSALAETSVSWTHKGPANKRSYDVCAMENLPREAKIVLEVFQSDAMFLLLSQLTGLNLHPMAVGDDSESSNTLNGLTQEDNCAACRMEVCRWKHGCYTLVHDTDAYSGEQGLDAIFYVGCSEWNGEAGGQTVYISKDADEELLTVMPMPNSLALVYRDPETLRFVKHINCRAANNKHSQFFTVTSVYYEEAKEQC